MVTEIIEQDLSSQEKLELLARRFINTGVLFNKTQLVYRDSDGGAYVIDIKHYKSDASFPTAFDEIPEKA